MGYRDAVWHERVTARVKRVIEKLKPSKPITKFRMDVLASSGGVLCN